MQTISHSEGASFPTALSQWRKIRRMSQLELALTAEVSQRHISWLETGRSEPSRNMILRLCRALEIPLRNRNNLLTSAGFANLYRANELSAPAMESVRDVLHTVLDSHMPYPALVVDRFWNIKMINDAIGLLFSLGGDPDKLWQAVGSGDQKNLALLTVHPKGLRRHINNYEQMIGPFIQRLQREAAESLDSKQIDLFREFQEFAEDGGPIEMVDEILPFIPLEINTGNKTLKLCSVISNFGTAQDITSHELRIETFYPADRETKLFFHDHKSVKPK